MNRDTAVSLLTSAKAQSYIDQVESLVKGVPHLPKVVTDILVSITPWLVIISGILSAVNGLQYILYAFGVQNIAVTAGISSVYWLLVGVQHIVSAYLSVLAFQLLREHKYTGWVLLFWNMATAVFSSLVSILFIPGSLIPSLFAIVLGIYLTFEIKPYFTGDAKVAEVLAPESEIVTKVEPAARTKRTSKSKKSTTKK
jgi:hypothetical protein